MGWVTPRTWNPGETATASLFNAHLRDELNVLKTEVADSGKLRRLAAKCGSAVNTSTGETDLTGYSVVVFGGELADFEGYQIDAAGSLAANTNTKTLRIDVAGQKTTLVLNTTNVAGNRLEVHLQVIRDGATTARLYGFTSFNSATGAAPTIWHFGGAQITGLTWSGSTTIKLTGQGGATNDIIMVCGSFRRLLA